MARFLVVGCGSIGKRRARDLARLGAELVLVDTDVAQLDATLAELALIAPPDYVARVERYQGYDYALRNYTLAGGFVCVPDALHIAVATNLAHAGVNLFIEKPIAPQLEIKPLQTLWNVCRENGLVGLMGQSWRFNPRLRNFALGIQSRALLSAVIYSGQHLDEWWSDVPGKETPYARAGIENVSLAHSLDTAQYCFGEIEALTALIAGTNYFGPGNDIATLLLRMKNGAQVVVHNNFWSSPRRDYIEAVFAEPENSTEIWEPDLAGRALGEMYHLETKHAVCCFEQHQQGQPDLLQGILNLEWIEAARRASANGTWQRIDNAWKTISGRK